MAMIADNTQWAFRRTDEPEKDKKSLRQSLEMEDKAMVDMMKARPAKSSKSPDETMLGGIDVAGEVPCY